MDELRNQFEELYKKHEIEILGAWVNKDNSTESFYLSKYEDEEDYRKKTDELRNDDKYIELTARLKEIRVDSKATRLTPKWFPN